MSSDILRTWLQPGSRNPPEENEVLADRVQTSANEVAQKQRGTGVDDNLATKAGGQAVAEVKKKGVSEAERKLRTTTMGDSLEEAEEKWIVD